MKEIMQEVHDRFNNALNDDIKYTPREIMEIYNRVSAEVYLEKVDLLLNRR